MNETQPSISIEHLFELRFKLGEQIGKIEDQLQKSFFQNLLDIFLLEIPTNYDEIQRKGIYKALILGTSDLSIINSFVGVNTSALASNEDYLISIHRTFREQFLKIDFAESLNLSEDSKRIITNVFRKKNPDTNIERSLKDYPQKPLPSLLIKNFDLSLLQSFDDDIRLLKSTKSIERVTLGISFPSDILNTNNIFSLCRYVDIVPCGYDFSQLNISDLTNSFHESKYYNFIILNNKDDFSIQAFLDLFLCYETKLEIRDELSRKVLESIFYILDSNVLNQTRLLQEKPQYREKIKKVLFKSNVDQRHNYQVILLLLTYLEYYFLQNSSTPVKLYERISNKINQNINSLFNKLNLVIRNYKRPKESESLKPRERFNSFENVEISSLWYAIFNSKSTQDVLFELSKLLSYEILSIMVCLGIEQQDSTD
ncbi:hypothetical protein NIES2100_30620 [Calothrix sp. NIES-2100]|uniref:hypothetical protein n=1 Tax=Calothrix sp. NIES-2100 TaxID=1954172 RepID=UPI000B60275A|nr:hypothetical protein NIES2100_30620 [Calothrix sp. NIES-2100]